MFIKTFFDVIMSNFQNVEVIILRRELSLVLKSFIEMGYFSNLNDIWPDWLSSPNAATKAIPCIASDEEMDQYDLSIAYLIDIEARALRFQKDYPQIPVHNVRLESLSDYGNVSKLFEGLRIDPTGKTKKFFSQIINKRQYRKEEINNPSDLGYCKERIKIYLEKARSKKILMPDTLALSQDKT